MYCVIYKSCVLYIFFHSFLRITNDLLSVNKNFFLQNTRNFCVFRSKIFQIGLRFIFIFYYGLNLLIITVTTPTQIKFHYLPKNINHKKHPKGTCRTTFYNQTKKNTHTNIITQFQFDFKTFIICTSITFSNAYLFQYLSYTYKQN